MSIQSSTIARPLDARLLNADVLASVFDELEWDEDPVEFRATCARAARVCHSFASVALPKLWRWLSDFVPLWNLLLPDHVPAVTPSKLALFYEARNQLISIVKENKLYQDASRWGRFLRYASYVQRLDRAYFIVGEIDLLRSVIAHNDHRTFLPGLRRLAWMQDEESGTILASLISTSGFVELHLHDKHMAASEELMALLPSRVPTLRKLVFVSSVYSAWDDIALVKSLTGLKHLQSLRLDSNYRLLHYDLLRQLFASLPLEHLYFYIADLNDLARPCSISAPHLRFLECKGSMADMVALLPHLYTPSLTTFKFESLFEETSDHVLSMCTILSQRPFLDTLKGISLAMRLPFGPPYTLEVVDLLQNLLYPILSMSCLESLSFVCPKRVTTPITITDEDIATVARALPNLKCLEIIAYASEPVTDHWFESQSRPSPPPPLLSVTSLIHLAQYSPHLEELHLQALRVDLKAVPVPTPPPAQSHPLQLLTLRDPGFEKHIDDMTGFLQFLDRLFPNLQSTGQRHAVPRSLQPQEQSYLYDFPIRWGRCGAAGRRNIFLRS